MAVELPGGADPEALQETVSAVVRESGCELWELKLQGPAGRRVLQVFVDSPAGVDLETTARISRALRPLLDDPAVGLVDANLEVSSPGAERPLRGIEDCARYVGRRVRLRFRSGDAETVVEGPLVEAGAAGLRVVARSGRVIDVSLDQLIEARGAVDFGGRRDPGPEVPPSA